MGQEMIDHIRKMFEDQVYPSFPGIAHGLRRDKTGQYVSPVLEDHWQTYQEGWQHALEYAHDFIEERLKQ